MVDQNSKKLLDALDIGVRVLDKSKNILYSNNHSNIIHGNEPLIKDYVYDDKQFFLETYLQKDNSFQDHLTGAKNHKALINDMYAFNAYSIIMIDINSFKELNESYGLQIGNKVLKILYERLRKEGVFIYRYSGDVFCIRISTSQQSVIKDYINLITEKIKKPFLIDNKSIEISISIGVAINNCLYIDPEILLRNVDTALHVAKESKDMMYYIYDKGMTEKIQRRVEIQHDLRLAIKRGEFHLVYQPQEDLVDEKLIGYEALLRWGKYFPDEFIPIAESSGLILDLGYLVIDMAIKQAAIWKKNIAINLSPKQLKDIDLINYIKNTLKTYKCDPKHISFEVTESYIMEDPEHAIIQLKKIKDLGIDLHLDDFGTGYSSLAYLKKLPISKIKIDKSFIDNLAIDEDDQIIVKAIINLSENLNLRCIAEGVETSEQKDKLKLLGCKEIQGYLYGKPLKAEEIEC